MQNIELKHSENKSLINSFFIGIFYFIFSWSIDFTDIFILKVPFILLMQFLPGLTFPLSTTNYKSEFKNKRVKITLHLFLSILIYYGSIWFYSSEILLNFTSIIAGIIGSFSYLTVTKLLLKKEFKFNEITVVALLSGIPFIPLSFINSGGFSMGFAILFWTITNATFININEKRNTTANTRYKQFGDLA